MLSSVLRSKRAVSVNIEIMRAFVKLRQMLASNTNSHVDWMSLKASMIASSRLCSTRFGN